MNATNVIQPYWYADMWVFDDPRVGLSAEPFVGGADTMIDRVTADIPNQGRGSPWCFRPSRSQTISSAWSGDAPTAPGNVHYAKDLDAEGWLCPALLRYLEAPPAEIYVQVKPKAVGP